MRVHLVAAAAPNPGAQPRFPGADEPPVPPPADAIEAVRGHLGRWTLAVRGPEAAAEVTVSALVDGPVDVVDALRAPSFGTWADRPLDEVLAEDRDGAARWRQDPTWAPPDGESLADLCARVEAWLEEVAEDRVLAVVDAAVARAAAVVALGAGPASCWRIDVGALAVVRLQRHDGTWRLRAIHP